MRSKGKFLSLVLGLLLALALCMCLVFAGCSSSKSEGEEGNASSEEDGTPSDKNNTNSGTTGGETGVNDTATAIEGLVAPVGNESMTTTTLKADALAEVGDAASAVYTTADEVLADDSITEVTNKEISASGAYYIDDTNEVSGKKITISADDVTLYLINASVHNDGTAIESSGHDLTITVIGDNEIYNSTDKKNSIDIEGTLTINGPGSLSISSTKNIKATSFIIVDATVTLSASKDALHAEIPDYDDNTEAPEFSFADGGFVYTKNASVTVTEAGDDGIQADTFIYIDEDSALDITASGKGIKAGCIDWGDDDTELEDGDYFIYINGDVTVNSTDDAIHSNNTIIIDGGYIDIASTGDDAVHADDLLQIYDGYIEILNCYEGIEAANIEITGGQINLVASDDGINAADGTETQVGTANSNCSLLINGGVIYVDASGDGVDSNGSMTISGGILYISGSTNGADQGLDADGDIVITGGYVFATGADGMATTISSKSTQNSIVFTNSSQISAGTIVYLMDADGNELLYYALPKAATVIVFSCPELTTGSKYYIYGGDTQLASVQLTSVSTSAGSSNSGSITNPDGGSQSGAGNGSFGGSGIGGGQGGSHGGMTGGSSSGRP